MSAYNYFRDNFKRFQEKEKLNQCGVTVQPLLNSYSRVKLFVVKGFV